MGAFTNDGGPPTTQEQEPEEELEVKKDDEKKEEEPVGFKTDVKDVMADKEFNRGIDKFPVFKVNKADFYQNMQNGRKRLRFKTGSTAQQYMKGTKYKRAFYIEYTDSKGKTFNRRIK